MTPGDSKREKIESKGDQKLHQKQAKGRQKEAKGNQKWAKGRQKETKRVPILRIFDISRHKKGGSRKIWEKVGVARPRDHLFWNNFPLKINVRIDVNFDAEKVTIFEEFVMRKWTGYLIVLEKCVHEKTYFSKQVHVRKPYVSSSRIRVGEGFVHDQVARNRYTIDNKSMQIGCA